MGAALALTVTAPLAANASPAAWPDRLGALSRLLRLANDTPGVAMLTLLSRAGRPGTPFGISWHATLDVTDVDSPTIGAVVSYRF